MPPNRDASDLRTLRLHRPSQVHRGPTACLPELDSSKQFSFSWDPSTYSLPISHNNQHWNLLARYVLSSLTIHLNNPLCVTKDCSSSNSMQNDHMTGEPIVIMSSTMTHQNRRT